MTDPVGSESSAARGMLSKIVAGLLLLLGFTGLTFAVATQLDEAWSGNFQAGSLLVESDCQLGNQVVTGKLGKPILREIAEAGESPWAVTQVEFSNISDRCTGMKYEVAYRTGSDWALLDSGTAQGIVTGSQVIVDLGGLDSNIPTEFAIVFFQ